MDKTTKITGKPKFMKELNISEIKRAILKNPMITRSNIASLTNISLTTVGNILTELIRNEDIFTGGYEESSGGRKAERYYFNKEKYHSLSFCIDNKSIKYIISNILNEETEHGELEVNDRAVREVITEFTEYTLKQKDIKAIALGVPGIVKDSSYLIKGPDGEWIKNDIGEFLRNKFGIPVILENDLNSTVLGFSINFAGKNKDKELKNLSSVYIDFSDDCTGAGIITNGEIVRGKYNFAGEFGFIPMNGGKTLDDIINDECGNEEYVETLVKLILIINYTINPGIIIMRGERFREELHNLVVEECKKHMPEGSFPEIIFKEHSFDDYIRGISSLGAELMHKNIGL